MANLSLNAKKIEQTVNPHVSDPGDGYSVISDTITVRSAYQTEEQKKTTSNAPLEENSSYLDVLYDEWFNKLKTSNVSCSA